MKKTLLFLFFAMFALSWQADAQFTENFEGSFLPAGWDKELGDAANDITQNTSQNHTSGGSKSARFSSYNSASDYNQYLFTAPITVQAGVNDQISFWHRKYDSSSETLEWGVSTTTQTSGAVSSWTAVTLSSSEWQQTTVDLSAYVGQTIYFAWHYYGDYLYYVYLDDVVSEALPACPAPSAQTESSITDTQADLGWTENGSATTWDIEWGPTGFTQGTGTTVSGVTANPYTLSGLTANTSYDWYVRADCGGGSTSNWTGPHTFTTNLSPGTCGLFRVDLFDSFGDGWNDGTLDVYINGTAYYTGLTLSNGTGPESHQIPVDIGDILSFDYTAGSFSSENEYKVYDESNNLVADEGAGGATPGDIGDHTIPTGLTACAQCPDPTLQTESNITYTSADLGWQENGSATTWDIELGATGFTPTGTPTQAGVTSNPYTYSGLTSGTTYDWYVRADCGSGSTSNWTGPHTFTTLTPPPANDDCSGAIVASVNSDQTCTSVTSGDNRGATESMTGCAGTANDDVWFKFTATYGAHDFEITNIVAVEGTSTDMVHEVFSGTCGSLTSLKCSDPNTSSVTGLTIGETYYVRVYSYYSSSRQTFDLCIKTPPCDIPTDLSANNETTTGADLSWTENGGADHWDLYIVTAGSPAPDASTTPTVDNTTANPYTWTGGNLSTDYDWYVRADCGASGGSGQSDWSAKGTFTTASADAVDWCNLQWPDQATITAGGSVTVYARVYEPGVTDASGQGTGITSWIGYSTSDTDPSTWTDWLSATYNTDTDGDSNDEYQADLGAGLTPGTYYYASRFKLNSGAYKYGGYSSGGGGFWNGSTYVSGVLTVNPVTGDMLCDAISLTVDDAPATYSNSNCTGETGEPNGTCWSGTSTMESIWFSFEAPSTGSVEVTTDFVTALNDTHIAIYEVTDCNDMSTLTEKGCDEDGGSTGNGWNSIADVYGLIPGDTYYVQVDGYGSSDGVFKIQVKTINCPTTLVVLPASASSTTSSAFCIDGDWINYFDGTNMLLSLDLTNAGITVADITNVTVDAGGATDAFWAANDGDGFPNVLGATGGAFMRRKWDVNASTQPTGDVGVRFYYTNDEYNAVNTEITNQGGTALTSTSQLNFFKVLSGEDPWNLEPGGVGGNDIELQTSGGTAGINTFVDGTFSGEHYAEFLVSSFSGGGGGGASKGASLPLKLGAFSGYADKDANILNWSTITETNSSMFYVERSESGKEWSSIAKVEAAGDSYMKKDYQAIDSEPISKAFYRLRMTDRDGRYSMSKVISIERKEAGLKLNAVFPNPNDGNFVVNLTTLPDTEGQMVLVNALGVKVYTKSLSKKGGTYIEKINVNHLPDGIYTLLIEQNNTVITKRVAISK